MGHKLAHIISGNRQREEEKHNQSLSRIVTTLSEFSQKIDPMPKKRLFFLLFSQHFSFFVKESTQEMMDAAGGAAAGEDSDSSCAPKVYWNEPRHLTCGIPKPVFPAPSWKLSSVVCESPTLVFFFFFAWRFTGKKRRTTGHMFGENTHTPGLSAGWCHSQG